MKNYYYILGITQTSSQDDIKKAYRKLSIKFHPDKNDGDKFFEERFKEIQEAFEILSSELKRRNYDIQFSAFFTKQNTNFNYKNYEEQIRKEYETLIQKERDQLRKKESELKNKEEQLKNKQKEFETKASEYTSNSKKLYEDQYKSKFEGLKREKEEIEKLKIILKRKNNETNPSSNKNTSLILAISCLVLIIISIFLYLKSQNTKSENNYSEQIDTVVSIKPKNASKPDRISVIRNSYKEINDCIICKDQKYNFMCGWISVRMQEGNINKITVMTDMVGDVAITREFYIENNDLLFVYEVMLDYNGVKTEYRYYFENNKIIKQITPPTKSIINIEPSTETELNKDFIDLIDCYRKGSINEFIHCN